jgi:DNA-binding GntR family transcriptional regulator
MEAAVAASDESRLTQLDIKFHDGVYRAAKHDRLTNAWNTIRSQMLLFLLNRAAANRDYLTIAVAEHTRIVELIRAGDVEAAKTEIHAHASGAYERLVLTYPATDRADFPTLDDAAR